jgi:hypothetical protein
MKPLTPLVSLPQRAVAALLWVGSWVVGVQCFTLLVEHFPRILALLRAAEAAQEPELLYWAQLGALVLGAVLAGVVLVASTLGLLLVEGLQVMADELGIAVELFTLPGPLARRLGAGRLPWKHVTALERRGPFFVLRGHGRTPGSSSPPDPVLRFLMVDEMERLVLMVLERSPHLRFEEDGD